MKERDLRVRNGRRKHPQNGEKGGEGTRVCLEVSTTRTGVRGKMLKGEEREIFQTEEKRTRFPQELKRYEVSRSTTNLGYGRREKEVIITRGGNGIDYPWDWRFDTGSSSFSHKKE